MKEEKEGRRERRKMFVSDYGLNADSILCCALPSCSRAKERATERWD